MFKRLAYFFVVTCTFCLLTSWVTPAAFAATSGGGKKSGGTNNKPKITSIPCSQALNGLGESYCDKDLTNKAECANVVNDNATVNQANAQVCCTGKAEDRTYHYSPTGGSWEPCSVITVTGTGANEKINIAVDKDRDCVNNLCKDFPPHAIDENGIDLGRIECGDDGNLTQ